MNLYRIKLNICLYPFLIVVVGIITYRNVIFSTGPAFQIVDIKDYFFPIFYFMRKAFMAGEFPFWDPYTMLGQSHIVNVGVLYPFLLGFLSMGFLGPLLPRHLELLVVAHMLLSGLTMYIGARKLGLGRLGSFAAGIVFQTAIINKEIIFYCEYAFGLPWVPLAISFGIALFRSEKSVFAKENFLSFFTTIVSLILLISTTTPYLIIYTSITLVLAMFYYMLVKIRIKDWARAVGVFIKAFWIFLIPVLTTAVITIPSLVILRDSIRFKIPPLAGTRMFFLKTRFIWTMIFPGWTGGVPPFAYTGIIGIILAVFYCITDEKIKDKINPVRDSVSNGVNAWFPFVISAIFWFYYSLEDSFLERTLRMLPVMSSMRVTLFGLVIYAYALSILSGKGLERISGFRDYRIGFNRNWLFTFFIVFMLIYSRPLFFNTLPSNFRTAYAIPLFFGCIFILYLIFVKTSRVGFFLTKAVPIVLFLEVFISSPHFIHKSQHERFFPYDCELTKLETDFPECYKSRDLYRDENLCLINDMGDYYFNRFGSYGFYGNGSQSFRYYYLWSKTGEIKGAYEKAVIPLDSKLYDLAGVRYFYLPEHEHLFIDYEKSGQGEWVSALLFNETLVSGIGIYNTPNHEQRRMLKAKVVLNDTKEISIDIPDEGGWHRFYFESIMLTKFRVIAEEVTSFAVNKGSRGVVIGEIELLDSNGQRMDAAVKEFDASSTMTVSKPDMIMDNRLGHVWESRCSVLADRTLASKTLERIREGCYINKNVLPRAFMVHKHKYFEDIDGLIQELHSDSFFPSEAVLLEGLPINFNIPEGPYSDNVEIVRYRVNEVEIAVKNDKPGFLILTDIYSPGWQVVVDGSERELLIADGVFRGVFLDSGTHVVLFKYTPPLLKLGFGISLVGIVLIVILSYLFFIL